MSIMHTLKTILTFIKKNTAITSFDITLFLRQLATLLVAGIPIIECCEMLEKSQTKQSLRLLIYGIKRDLLSGKQLSASFTVCGTYFNPLICELIKIGESTGRLDKMLLTIANYQEKNLLFKKKIRQACFYPAIIAICALAVTLGLFIFVIPRFADLFQEMNDKLPLLTRALFYFSSKINQSLSFVGIIFLIFLILLKHHYPQLKPRLIIFYTSLPFIKTCQLKLRLMHFARNLAITFAAGIPLNDGLKLAINASDNKTFKKTLLQLRNQIISGENLHSAMEQLSLFPSLMTQMVKVGEETGMLDAMLEKIADFFESETDLFITKLTQLLEPLIMVVQGVLIGGIVIGMYLPIFRLGNTL